MIKGVHTMFYTSDALQLRTFLRDKLGLNSFTDTGDGWLIFNLPEADMGVHPTGHEGSPPSGTANISFYCDDIETTVKELKAKGVEFADGIEDRGYGLVTHFKMPGDFEGELYQPSYTKKK
jgi:catechol 2,3-dioxygenase-like lactoylglutathione lyase family enzyme